MGELWNDYTNPFFAVPRWGVAECGCCGGSGVLRVLRRFWFARKENCPMCNGRGRVLVPWGSV
jgi:DnaJ-class molecular chaperone